MSSATPRLHALLVGIDYYPPPGAFPPELVYPDLAGCVRDVGRVRAYLQSRLGVADDRIVTLTSSPPREDGSWPEPPERLPTYVNLKQAFERVTGAAGPGDLVYVHYSGHGGRTPTAYAKLKAEGDLYDESLAPREINDPRARYLRDVELGFLLRRMVKKGLVVTLVLDSCHSGGATRDAHAAGVRVRGGTRVDPTRRPTDSLIAAPGELEESWREAAQGEATRSATRGVVPTGWVPAPGDYVLLAACRADQTAAERPFEGEGSSGVLTHFLMEVLQGLSGPASYRTVYDRVLARVSGSTLNQTPLLLGPEGRAFLGTDVIPVRPSCLVVALRDADEGGGKKEALIQAGQAMGVRKGTAFAVYPAGGDVTDPARRLALAEAAEVRGGECWATLSGLPGGRSVEPGDAAVLLGSSRLRRGVRLRAADGASAAERESLEAVRRELTARAGGPGGWVKEAGAGEEADFHVSVGGEPPAYVIGNAEDQPLANLPRDLRPGAPGVAGKVVDRLEHLARYRNVEEIDNHAPDAALSGKLGVELLGRQDDYEWGEKSRPVPFPEGGVVELPVGSWTFLRLENRSPRTLNVAVLDLRPDWGVSLAYPSGTDLSYEVLEPGKTREVRLQASLPDGWKEGTKGIKVFATVGVCDFRAMELPALGQPAATRGAVTKAASRGSRSASALDGLLGALTESRPKTTTRNMTAGAVASEDWTVEQVQIRVKRP